MKLALLLAAICACVLCAPAVAADEPAQVTPNTWRAAKDAPRPAVTPEIARWLAGQYVGHGFDGEIEYQWLPPRAGALFGTFRLIKDGKTAFSEILTLTEAEGTLVLRVKHFSPEFVAWEEKDKSVDFRLHAASPGELRFDGLTIRRTAEGLVIFLAMRRDGALREHELRLKRIAATQE
jgi:Domain of unknown function (DUF6265)